MLKTMTAIAATALMASAAAAFPAIYTDEATFRQDTSSLTFAQESFERTLSGSNSYDFGALTASCGNCSLATSGRFPTDGRFSLGYNTGVSETLTFTFDTAVNAVSFDLSSFGSLAPGNLVLTINGQRSQLLTNHSGSESNRLFFGISNAEAFTSFSLTGGTSGDTAYIDRLRYAARAATPPPAVPEPATWAMMIGGFGLVGGSLRRRAATPSVA